ncbi:MAG: peptidoglycan-binding protein [Sphaerochaeta sp.]|jgi:peptidoglycan L-alanyl-D-glutamate endopeptidase CwlK|nr:peptidoglycan-binding protein [Sphaerochaeta sp.]MDY0187811.1 peptidoglycan-binding protein [Syntrophus sp. (in: bacteria)]
MFAMMGYKGHEITALQRKLRAAGYDPGLIDGFFWGETCEAVRSFQLDHNLIPDGVVGPATWRAIQEAVGSVSAPDSTGGDRDILDAVTPKAVATMFPATPLVNIIDNLPHITDALRAFGLDDRWMVAAALATIRAETESFLPISEGISKYNTTLDDSGRPVNHPFDLYDDRRDLGNQGAPDGERYRGRGFIQLTGRYNYLKYGGKVLSSCPELANDSKFAALLLASFLADQQEQVRSCMKSGNLAEARRLVNGGRHGLDRFTDAVKRCPF